MLMVFTITGIFLIIMGFLVKKNPNLLAGYNTLSEIKKKEIDIEKVSTLARNVLFLTGAAVIDSNIIMYFLKISEQIQILVFSGVVLIGVILLIILANRIQILKI